MWHTIMSLIDQNTWNHEVTSKMGRLVLQDITVILSNLIYAGFSCKLSMAIINYDNSMKKKLRQLKLQCLTNFTKEEIKQAIFSDYDKIWEMTEENRATIGDNS